MQWNGRDWERQRDLGKASGMKDASCPSSIPRSQYLKKSLRGRLVDKK